MSNSQNIADIFSIFHDGSIDQFTIANDSAKIEIGIEYLAELIDPAFETFKIHLSGFQNFSFHPWEQDQPSILQISEIPNLQLGILDAKTIEDLISISCTQDHHDLPWTGADLRFLATSFQIFDQADQELSLSALKELSKTYWDKFK